MIGLEYGQWGKRGEPNSRFKQLDRGSLTWHASGDHLESSFSCLWDPLETSLFNGQTCGAVRRDATSLLLAGLTDIVTIGVHVAAVQPHFGTAFRRGQKSEVGVSSSARSDQFRDGRAIISLGGNEMDEWKEMVGEQGE